jgi:hypothetical protein
MLELINGWPLTVCPEFLWHPLDAPLPTLGCCLLKPTPIVSFANAGELSGSVSSLPIDAWASLSALRFAALGWPGVFERRLFAFARL